MKSYVVYTKFGIQTVSAHGYEIESGALILLKHSLTSPPVEVAIFAPGAWIRCDVSEMPPSVPDQVAREYFKEKG